MNNIFWCSDLHIFHKNIIHFCDRKFSSVEEMNEKFIENINKTVGPKGELWHLGDLSFGSLDETIDWLKKLKIGKLRILLGNHDDKLYNYRNKFFESQLIDTMEHYKILKFEKTKIVMFHFPIFSWLAVHHNSIHLHGHCHAADLSNRNNTRDFGMPTNGKYLDVGIDSAYKILGEYRPFSWDEIKDYMKTREVAVVDHHGEM